MVAKIRAERRKKRESYGWIRLRKIWSLSDDNIDVNIRLYWLLAFGALQDRHATRIMEEEGSYVRKLKKCQICTLLLDYSHKTK